MTAPSDLYELKVVVEADDWHEMSALMDAVDRALDPHRRRRGGSRRWSVIANRLPARQARELLWFFDQVGMGTGGPPAERISA